MRVASHYVNGAILGAMAVALPVAAETIGSPFVETGPVYEAVRQVPALVIFAYVLTVFLKDKREEARTNREVQVATTKALRDVAVILDRLERKLP